MTPPYEAKLTFDSLRVEGEHFVLVFADLAKSKKLRSRARYGRTVSPPRLAWGNNESTTIGGRHFPSTELHAARVEHSLPAFEADKSALDPAKLHAMLDHARAEESSAIVIVKDGKIATEMYREGYDGGPLVAMSSTKSMVSLAIGLLIEEGKLSLDTSMGTLFPSGRPRGRRRRSRSGSSCPTRPGSTPHRPRSA